MHPIPVLAAALALAACDTTRATTVGNVAQSGANTLTIIPATSTVNAGATVQMSTNAPLTQVSQIQWGSSNTGVATISPSGSLNALTAGTTTISARYSFDTTRVATATVNVIAAPGTTGTAQRNP